MKPLIKIYCSTPNSAQSVNIVPIKNKRARLHLFCKMFWIDVMCSCKFCRPQRPHCTCYCTGRYLGATQRLQKSSKTPNLLLNCVTQLDCLFFGVFRLTFTMSKMRQTLLNIALKQYLSSLVKFVTPQLVVSFCSFLYDFFLYFCMIKPRRMSFIKCVIMTQATLVVCMCVCAAYPMRKFEKDEMSGLCCVMCCLIKSSANLLQHGHARFAPFVSPMKLINV